MSRFDAFSLSLAELALNLLFVLLLMFFAVTFTKASYEEEQLAARNRVIDKLKAEIVSKDAELAGPSPATPAPTAMAATGHPPVATPAARAVLRSAAFPPCLRDPVFIVTVLGSDSFEIDGALYSERAMAARFVDSIAEVTKVTSGCVNRVRARPGQSVALKDYLVAVERLERHFYVKRID